MENKKVRLPLNVLIVVKSIIFLINFHILRTKKMIKKKFIRKIRNIKRETREETRRNSSRKISTQRRIIHHQMRMMIVKMT
jgi:hypothetical protein